MVDTLHPRESGEAQRPLRSTYRATLRDILALSVVASSETLPAAAIVMRDEIKDYRENIRDCNDPKKLKARIEASPTLRMARTPADYQILDIVHAGTERTKIKFLNDNFGPDIANAIIDKRDLILNKLFEYFGIAKAEDIIDNGFKVAQYRTKPDNLRIARTKLESNYNADVLARNGIDPESTNDLPVINYILKTAEIEIRAATKSILESEVRRLREIDENDPIASKIDAWLSTDLQHFTLNFGLSEVLKTPAGTTVGLEQRVWAHKQGEWIARASCQRYTNNLFGDERRLRGGVFNITGLTNDIATARTEILADTELTEFFEEITDRELGRVRMLRGDVVNNLRKWDAFIEKNADNPDLIRRYEKLKRYYLTINSIDYIFPWATISDASDAIQKVEAICDGDNIDALKSVLTTDERDVRDCKSGLFHHLGTDYSEAYYISLDVIGIGNMNVRDFERICLLLLKQRQARPVKSVADEKEQARKLLMQVGNTVTAMIQAKINDAREILETELPGIKFHSLRGGDEWTVIIPHDPRLKKEQVFKAINKVNNRTGMRAAVSNKESLAVLDDNQRILDHYQALETNARNNAIIKELEALGLYNVVAIPDGNGSGALFPDPEDPNSTITVDKIGALLSAAQGLKARGRRVSIDAVIGVLSAMEKKPQ